MNRNTFRPGPITRIRSTERGDFMLRPPRRSYSAHDVRATNVLADFKARRDRRSSAMGVVDTSRQDAVEFTPKTEELENSLKDSSFRNYVEKSLNIYHAKLRMTPYYTGKCYDTQFAAVNTAPLNRCGSDIVDEMRWRNVPIYLNTRYDLRMPATYSLTPSLGPQYFHSSSYWNNKRFKESLTSMEISRFVPPTLQKSRA